jgi:hypothetical protein
MASWQCVCTCARLRVPTTISCCHYSSKDCADVLCPNLPGCVLCVCWRGIRVLSVLPFDSCELLCVFLVELLWGRPCLRYIELRLLWITVAVGCGRCGFLFFQRPLSLLTVFPPRIDRCVFLSVVSWPPENAQRLFAIQSRFF